MADRPSAQDPYAVLGVPRDADAAAIRRAFRAVAKKDHPDLNPGDASAEARFKAASAAHDLLSDPERRARFDRGEIDASGQEVPPRGYWRDHAEGAAGARYHGASPPPGGGARGLDPEAWEALFGLFGTEGRARPGPRRGADARYRLEVEWLDALNGATRRLTLPDGRDLDVRVPPGLEDGQVLRLRGRGGAGREGGAEGDALIEVSVRPHPHLRREGRDVRLDLPVTVAEAVLGARVTAPTPGGPVTLTVPPRSDTGAVLRLRGRGVPAGGGEPAGDLLVALRLVLGPVDGRLEEFLRGWRPEGPAPDPRAGMLGSGS